VSRDAPDIAIVNHPIAPAELRRLVTLYFGDMVKLVVDIERRIVAVGGELHADAEQLLLAQGSTQADLWGANYYPGRGADGCLEYTALINIRPSQGNRSMEIQAVETRRRVREIVCELVGSGDESRS
jgi:hypothetical protein